MGSRLRKLFPDTTPDSRLTAAHPGGEPVNEARPGQNRTLRDLGR